MDTGAYNLQDSYVTVGGEGMVPQVIDDFAKEWVAKHYVAAFALILTLTLIVLYFALTKCKEHFNPTQNLRDQDSDQFGLGRREHMDSTTPGADRGKSAFAQQVQSGGGGTFTATAGAAPNQPGSLAWQVLHSSDFNCDKRQVAGDDAWAWMNGVARENMAGGSNKPNNDNAFSQVLAGL